MSSIQHSQNKDRHQCNCYIFEMFLICRASTIHKHILASNYQQITSKHKPFQHIISPEKMQQERPARISKTMAISNMDSCVERPIAVSFDVEKYIITLRISKPLWNTCNPQPYRITKSQSKARTKARRCTKVLKTIDAPAKAVPTPSQLSTRQCKARFFRFHHGGLKRQKRGDRQNEITYEAPCLHFTCANCWKWNPHLMCTDDGDQRRSIQSLAEPVRSNDVTSVDSAQAMQKRRHDSVFSESEDSDLAYSPRSDRDITTLAFHSHEGRQKYAALIRTCEAQEKEENWRSLERKGMSARSAGSSCRSAGSAKSGSSSGRSRHRVKLVFGSQTGKQDFARLVQRYLC
jgi:hypothetical protein